MGAAGPRPLLIRGGRILDPARAVDLLGDVLLAGGRVARLGRVPDQEAREAEVIDATGLVVAPGFIDLHAHLRQPGFEDKETIATGLAAAARGGFTTVCCMPNTRPPLDSRGMVEEVLALAEEAGGPRLLPFGCTTRGQEGAQLAEMAELADAGVVAFSDDGHPVANSRLMRHALEYAHGLGLPVAEHCEDPELVRGGVMHEGVVATRLGLPGVPSAAEESAVARNIALAELTGARLHLMHVSTAGAVAHLRAAKTRGVAVTAEVTPHHLTLTDAAVAAGFGEDAYDTNAKVNPPLRSEEDRRALVVALAEGLFDAVATDHAPHTPVDKECEFDQAACGISGLETALGSLMELVHNGELDMTRMVAALTVGPASVLGLGEKVRPDLLGIGSLAEGAPADVTVFAPDAEWVVDPDEFASKGKNTPLAGAKLRGRVVATVCAGRVVHREGAVA